MTQDLTKLTIKGFPSPMIYIPKGDFIRGEGDTTKAISFEEGYHIGQYLLTQEIWETIMRKNPMHIKDRHYPAIDVSWKDICEKGGFLDTLNELDAIKKINAIDGKQFRLPSEAQWEYAASGGPDWKDGYTYSGSNRLKEVGWYHDNSHRETKPVGLRMPNQLELYDMSGNVWEWCQDIWHENYKGAPEDGSAWEKDGDQDSRVVRGGSWDFINYFSRVALRYSNFDLNRFNNIGFRLARY